MHSEQVQKALIELKTSLKIIENSNTPRKKTALENQLVPRGKKGDQWSLSLGREVSLSGVCTYLSAILTAVGTCAHPDVYNDPMALPLAIGIAAILTSVTLMSGLEHCSVYWPSKQPMLRKGELLMLILAFLLTIILSLSKLDMVPHSTHFAPFHRRLGETSNHPEGVPKSPVRSSRLPY